MLEIKIGQTWQLASGELVTVLSLPEKNGWLRCLSHDVGLERTYGTFAFIQPDARVVESKSSLRSLVKDLMKEILQEELRLPRRK